MTERGRGTRGRPVPATIELSAAQGGRRNPRARPVHHDQRPQGYPGRHHLLATTPRPLNLLGVLSEQTALGP